MRQIDSTVIGVDKAKSPFFKKGDLDGLNKYIRKLNGKNKFVLRHSPKFLKPKGHPSF